ncbi:MAG: antibiotic biosynthesis monooxygenase [Halomonas sp.]|nr:antibiotic biosynthesis monooxygenase [Halomonas sp.]
MYARSLTFKASADQREKIEALASSMAEVMQSLRGFVDLHYLVSEDATEYASISFWLTKDDAQAAGELLRDRALKQVETLATEPPRITVYEVYEPQSGWQAKAS